MKKMNNKFVQRNAYTLPELLITLLLLAILFTLGILLSSNLGQTKKLRDYSVAVALAQQAIEIVRSAPFEILDDADALVNTVADANDTIIPEFNSGNTSYKRKVIITDIMSKEDPKLPAGIKHVEVIVEWSSSDGGKADPFVMQTTVANMN
jgi:prepilin-type N-terminal cleavage/methylation domain-containing protein